MNLKKEVLEKIPNFLKKEPECKALLDYIKEQGLKEKEELRDFLKKEIKSMEKWLLDNKKRNLIKEFRDKTVRLKVLKKCEELIGGFLF